METKEEREARLRALEVEQLLEQQKNGHSWTSAVDDLVDSIKVNYKPIMKKRKQNGDEYTVPEHKYLKKLVALEDRIDRWKQVGPATTEDEWNQAVEDNEWVTECRRKCSKDASLHIPKALLIRMNKMWKKYITKVDNLITKNEK